MLQHIICSYHNMLLLIPTRLIEWIGVCWSLRREQTYIHVYCIPNFIGLCPFFLWLSSILSCAITCITQGWTINCFPCLTHEWTSYDNLTSFYEVWYISYMKKAVMIRDDCTLRFSLCSCRVQHPVIRVYSVLLLSAKCKFFSARRYVDNLWYYLTNNLCLKYFVLLLDLDIRQSMCFEKNRYFEVNEIL